ncbi:hypothetical protein A3K93_08940 [Acinetobacter sp. NCu2D-2]|uniref:hypothetical protein n=1 Tax=Acinetobacter sp. NCu2D-2 TaxID=1608473 RepID=UPI0007CDDF97|nr:hypothetical protein [Acinetobacter sp. NCu2D-2]ANF82308.1 hypothetical protein A3K93_08940 [Acinetobacter sp. NCu2D-2]
MKLSQLLCATTLSIAAVSAFAAKPTTPPVTVSDQEEAVVNTQESPNTQPAAQPSDEQPASEPRVEAAPAE